MTACALAFALTAASASRRAADWADATEGATTDASATGGVLRLPLWTLLCGYVLLGCSAVQARCDMQRDNRVGCGAALGQPWPGPGSKPEPEPGP